MAVATAAAIMIGAGIAATGAVAGAIISNNGVKKAAGAQIAATKDQIAAAEAAEARQRADRERAYSMAASAAIPSASEIAATKQLLDRNEASLTAQLNIIARAQQTLDTVDPIVKESGRQTLELLRGKTTEFLKPVLDQRSRQRTELENQLAQKLGPNFRSTSAGIAALNSFDQDTTTTMANVQFQAISQVANTTATLGSLASNIRSTQAAQTNSAFGQALTVDQVLLGQQRGLREAKTGAVNAFLGAPVNTAGVSAAYGNLANVAGNAYAGQIAAGQTFGNIAGSIGQAAIQYGVGQSLADSLKGPAASAAPPATTASAINPNNFRLIDPSQTNFGTVVATR